MTHSVAVLRPVALRRAILLMSRCWSRLAISVKDSCRQVASPPSLPFAASVTPGWAELTTIPCRAYQPFTLHSTRRKTGQARNFPSIELTPAWRHLLRPSLQSFRRKQYMYMHIFILYSTLSTYTRHVFEISPIIMWLWHNHIEMSNTCHECVGCEHKYSQTIPRSKS